MSAQRPKAFIPTPSPPHTQHPFSPSCAAALLHSSSCAALPPIPSSCIPHQVLKKNEQMFALLACCVALCPAAMKALDDHIVTQLK